MLEPDDHRSLARRLDLFHLEEDAPGMVFWHPRGMHLYRTLEAAARGHCRAGGYAEVKTPQILRRPAWEASGHWEHYRDHMFQVADGPCEAAVKPVSCPGHIRILQKRSLSHRDLPLRLSELGIVHRDEPGGTLHGLLRLRQFTQDDGHIFCRPDQAAGEALRFCAGLEGFYRAFGFADIALALSTRPDDRAGEDALWDASESALRVALAELGKPYREQPGAGAFYGPKIEVILTDRRGREWQCGTLQFDLVLPARFGLAYTDADGMRRPPVMLHRAVFGSLERFLGILLEHHGAALPAWLAPVQVGILPVTEAQAVRAREVEAALSAAGLRARLEGDGETLSRRVAESHGAGVPWAAVVGAKEAADGTLALRGRRERRALPLAGAVEYLRGACAPPPGLELD